MNQRSMLAELIEREAERKRIIEDAAKRYKEIAAAVENAVNASIRLWGDVRPWDVAAAATEIASSPVTAEMVTRHLAEKRMLRALAPMCLADVKHYSFESCLDVWEGFLRNGRLQKVPAIVAEANQPCRPDKPPANRHYKDAEWEPWARP